jgi:uncharacterized membrane protein HdeD (DUF308 family)
MRRLLTAEFDPPKGGEGARAMTTEPHDPRRDQAPGARETETAQAPGVPPQARPSDEMRERTTERPAEHVGERPAERVTERRAGEREERKPGFLATMGSWAPLFALGCVSLIVGIIALAWPGISLTAVAVLFAIQVLLYGAFCFAQAAAGDTERGGPVVMGFLGVFALIIGVLALRDGRASVTSLALLLGLFWFVGGALAVLATLVGRERTGRGMALALLTGCLAAAVGIIVLAIGGISLPVLTAILGVWLLVFGALTLGMAAMKKAGGRGMKGRRQEAAATR